MEVFTILAGIKSGLAAGRTVASLSKEIGKFFDETDQAKKAYSKKEGQVQVSGKRVYRVGQICSKRHKLKKS